MEINDRVETIEQLTAMYRPPTERAIGKQLDRIDGGMAAFIDLSPLLILSTTDGADSVDASPRGGPPGFVHRLDDRHIAIPDLNGNNRLDSYRNIVTHGRAGVLMLIPGKDETLRINGPAVITTDREILSTFTNEFREPKAAIVIETDEIYGHCAKAFRRARAWDPASWDDMTSAPDLAAMYSCMWNIDESDMRDALERTYDADLAED